MTNTKKSKPKQTYLPVNWFSYEPQDLNCPSNLRKKLISYFPKKYQGTAFKEIWREVTILYSCLKSKTTPKKLLKKDVVKEVKDLLATFRSVQESLEQVTRHRFRPSSIKFISAFYEKLGRKRSEEMISEFKCSISYSIAACKSALKNMEYLGNNVPKGERFPHHYSAIYNLALIWMKYRKKTPTRTLRKYELGDASANIRTEDAGDFIDFITLALKPTGQRGNRPISVGNMVRKVIRELKLAQIS